MSSPAGLTSASSARKRLLKEEDMTKVEFETSEEVDVTPTFDTMGLREDLLRGIYAYGVRQPCNLAVEHENQAFGMGGRLRKLKFADEELRILAEQVVAEEPRLFGSRTQKTSTREKSMIWDEITGRINAVAAVPRTTEEVKKRWQDLKCRVRTLASEHRRAVIAGGSAPPLILRSWEKMVLQILDPSSMEIFSRVDYSTDTRQLEGTTEQDENAMVRGDDSEEEWPVPIITHRVGGSAAAPKSNQMILTTSSGSSTTSGNNAHRQATVLPSSQQQSTSTSGVSLGWLSTQPASSPQDSSAGSSIIPPPVDMIDEVLANLSPRDVVCLLRRVLRLPPSSTECEDVNTSPVGSPRTADQVNATTGHETSEGTQPTPNQRKLDISTQAIDQVLARLTAIEAQQKIQTAVARDQLQAMQRIAAAAEDIAMTNNSVANANVGLTLERLSGVVERIASTISCMGEVLERRQHSSVEMEVSDLAVQNSQTTVPFTSSETASEESNFSSSRRSLRASGQPYPTTGLKGHRKK